MNLEEIKKAVDEGKKVFWRNRGYQVFKDKNDWYYIKFLRDGSCIGLTWNDGVTVNGLPHEFFTEYSKSVGNANSELCADAMVVGGKYNWKHQRERLLYKGVSGSGTWHQFALVENPGTVWCEVLSCDLHMLEETQSDEGSTEDRTHLLRNWMVTTEPKSAARPTHILFKCQAEDEAHAIEQAENSYPDHDIISAYCMDSRMLVACRNAQGGPDIFFFEMTEIEIEDQDNGNHYDAAEAYAESLGYEHPMLCFDEGDASEAFKGIFEWGTASKVTFAQCISL